MGLNVWPADAVGGLPSYAGRMLRQMFGVVLGGRTAARPLGARSGVPMGTPSTTVTATSTTWTVQPHGGVLDVEAAAVAGAYFYSIDSVQTGAMNAADATNPRIDLISVQLSDPAEGDGTAAPGIAIVYTPGSPASSPVAPGAPARSSLLATITVPASGGGSPVVTWAAPYVAANGGITVCQGVTYRPASPYVGQFIDDPTAGLMRWSGSAWVSVGPLLAGSTASTLTTGNAAVSGTQAFGRTYIAAPRVFAQFTNADGIHVNVTAVTTTGFSWQARTTSGTNVTVNHPVNFDWLAIGT